jgi:peptide deformylase
MTKIIQIGDKILEGTSTEVDISGIKSKEIQKVLTDMKKALEKEKDGVAIAAPQIGQTLRIFIVSKRVFPEENAKDQIYINPEIINLSKDKEWVEEGCLSVRWKYGKVERTHKITVEAYDEKGQKFQRGASGLLAQIFQHEIDHLNGILFTDKAKDVHEVNPEDLIKEK